jgi:hypothetical protein
MPVPGVVVGRSSGSEIGSGMSIGSVIVPMLGSTRGSGCPTGSVSGSGSGSWPSAGPGAAPVPGSTPGSAPEPGTGVTSGFMSGISSPTGVRSGASLSSGLMIGTGAGRVRRPGAGFGVIGGLTGTGLFVTPPPPPGSVLVGTFLTLPPPPAPRPGNRVGCFGCVNGLSGLGGNIAGLKSGGNRAGSKSGGRCLNGRCGMRPGPSGCRCPPGAIAIKLISANDSPTSLAVRPPARNRVFRRSAACACAVVVRDVGRTVRTTGGGRNTRTWRRCVPWIAAVC